MLRTDYLKIQKFHGDRRSSERLETHFVLERALADRLRNARAEDRAAVYTEVYSELFRSLPDHPQHGKRARPKERGIDRDIRQLAPFLTPQTTFLEIGCGDAALSFAIAPLVRTIIGMDIQEQLIDFESAPLNFRFVRPRDGICFPLETASIDVAFSDQLLEHLHPDDALAQVIEVARVLRPGGLYICSTPNAVTGPHDISMYFGHTAAGLHLKEYDYRQIRGLFQRAGFRHIAFQIRLLGRQITLPSVFLVFAERLFVLCPLGLRARLARSHIAERLMGIHALARK